MPRLESYTPASGIIQGEKGRLNFILPEGEPFVILNNGAGSFGGNPRGRQEESSLYSWLGLGIAK
jgi:hypothetical protein